jgi:hypothetical protein
VGAGQIAGHVLDAFRRGGFVLRPVRARLVDGADLVGRRIVLHQEELLHPLVVLQEQQRAVGILAVAAGAAGFLVIGFQVGGNLQVDHEAGVRLVDAHAEGVGRDHHAPLVVHEQVLVGLALGGRQLAVVDGDGFALLLQQLVALRPP